MDNTWYLGHYVIFAGEDGKLRAGRVTVIDPYDSPGFLGIDGDRGIFCREPEEVRLAEQWEVHRWEMTGSLN